MKEAQSTLGGLEGIMGGCCFSLGGGGGLTVRSGIYLVDVAQWIRFQTHVRRMSTCIYLGAGGVSCFYKCRFSGQWQLVCVYIF